MRRPLVCFCFAEASGLLFSYCTHLQLWHLCILCAGVFVFALATPKKSLLLLGLALFMMTGFLRMEAAQKSESRLQKFDGQIMELSGTVSKVDLKDKHIALTVKLHGFGGPGDVQNHVSENILIRLAIDEEADNASFAYDLVGRSFSSRGRISLPLGRRNPGGFDYRLYLKTKGIDVIGDVSRYRFLPGRVENSFLHFLSVRKGDFFQRARSVMAPESFALLAGLLFGEKSYMEDEAYQAFQQNGIAHILAVSGLHVGLLYAVLLKIFSGRKSPAVSLVTVVTIFTYAALANFAVSVLRASGMIVFAIAARHFRRRYDLVTAASAVAVVFMTWNPFQLFDSGLQLSFLAAYSLGVVLPYAELKTLRLSDQLKKEWIFRLGKIMNPCVVIQMCMAPLIAFQFFIFSPIGLIINPPALLLAGLLLPSGLLMFVISILTGPIQEGLVNLNLPFAGISGMAEALCDCLRALSETGSILGGGWVCPAPPLGLLLLFYGLLFFCFSEEKFILHRRQKHNRRRLSCIAVVAAACIFPWAAGLSSSFLPWKYDTPLLTFLDVGQGESLHIQTGGLNILVDGGGNFNTNLAEKTLQPYLLKNGITHVDLALITHTDMDHAKGIAELSARMPVDKLIVAAPYKEQADSYSDVACQNVDYVAAGDVIFLGEEAFLTILAPGHDTALSDSSNANSLVMLLSYQGLDVLLTGDMEMPGEAALPAGLSCDILKVAHHGSAGSTGQAFTTGLKPSFAVISCGINNSHGHPSLRVIELLEKSGIIIGRTDIAGAICLRSVTGEFFVLQNASKDMTWQIPRKDFR